MKKMTWIVTAALFVTALPSHAGNTCEVKSGATTAALVELYTSEGCSSCPPADRQLSRLRDEVGPNANLVPLSMHVTYWDAIGWKDVFAKRTFDERQRTLLVGKKNQVVYTPQFFVNGNELRAWHDNLPDTIRRINARPAPVGITLKTTSRADGTIVLDASATAGDAKKIDGDLYVAISENALTSNVLRGENSGVTLHHDHTVRLWYGPVRLTDGKASFHQEVQVPPGWNRRNLQAVAFVQAPDDGTVLQAVSTPQCLADAAQGL